MATPTMPLSQSILSSVQFLSRLPVYKFFTLNETPDFKASSFTYGLAGMLIALPPAIVLVIAYWAGLTSIIIAILSVSTSIVITGALHEDGLADMVDGFWGGHTVERKLAIMRDSAIGTYGVLSLVLTTALRVALLSALIDQIGLWACGMVVATGGLSRFAMLWPWSTLKQARNDQEPKKNASKKEVISLAAKYGAPDRTGFNKSIPLVLPALILIALSLPPLATITALALGTIAVVTITALSRHHIGGHTGDTLGATQQFCEIGLYLGACIAI